MQYIYFGWSLILTSMVVLTQLLRQYSSLGEMAFWSVNSVTHDLTNFGTCDYVDNLNLYDKIQPGRGFLAMW